MSNDLYQPIALAVRRALLLSAFAALPFASVSFAQDATVPSNTTADQTAATPAAPESGQANTLGEVTVTGTRIRGVAPVGSTVITVDQTAIVESGLTSTNDVLDTNPAIVQLGGIGNHTAGGLAVNNGFGDAENSPNIHGLGAQATLSLLNGHRSWSSGNNSDLFDPTSIPEQMLSRVEVVPDGTSPIYGADAVAGTVNYVLRAPADVVETYFGEDGSKGQNYWEATGILGHTWNDGESQSGGFIVGYQRNSQGALAASAYPDLYNSNFAPYGGAPAATFAAPGNVLVGGTNYAVPYGQNGQNLTLAQLGAAGSANRQNIWAAAPGTPGQYAIPSEVGSDTVVNYFQNLSDSVQFFGDGIYDFHTLDNLTSGSVNDVGAKVPNTNPYSPCNPSHYTGGVVTGPTALLAACATGSLTVDYDDLANAGGQWGWQIDKGWETSNGFHIKLPGTDWQITPQVSLNQHMQYGASETVGTPNPNTFNYFCDPTTYNCSQPGAIGVTIPPYQGTAKAGPVLSTGRFYQLQSDGSLFALPGGDVRLATGAEYDYWEAEKHTSTNTDPYKHDRAAYAEFYVPLVGGANAVAGIKSLEIDVAGRIDGYSDTGTTRNPKIGLNWSPITTLKFHGSFGTSFRGPPLMDEGSLAPTFTTSSTAASAISPTLCPNCTNPAYYGVDGANKLIYSEAMGNHTNLVPETSRSFSAGFDWTPEAVPGLDAGVNWWYMKYINQVGNPESNAGGAGAINQQYYNGHIIYNPTFFPQLAANNPLAYMEPTPRANLNDPNCAAVVGKHVTTQALFNDFVSCAADNSGGQSITGTTSSNPNDILAVTYYGQQNAGSTLGDGFDLNAGYAWRNDLGNWKANFTGEYIPRFDVSVIPGAPTLNEAGQFGYVLKFKSRAQLNWQRNLSFGSLSPSLFINYDSSYQMPLSLLPAGVYSQYANIDAHVTFDVSVVYDTGTAFNSWIAKNITMTLSSQNVLNEMPPRVINSTILFDPAYGWPPSRVIQFQIGKKW